MKNQAFLNIKLIVECKLVNFWYALACFVLFPQVILQYNQLDLIMHPVFQKLLDVKWNLFGKWGTFGLVAINLFYTLIWTVLGIFLPRHGEKYYSPMSETWWRLVLEVFGVLMTVYFIFSVSIEIMIIIICLSLILS